MNKIDKFVIYTIFYLKLFKFYSTAIIKSIFMKQNWNSTDKIEMLPSVKLDGHPKHGISQHAVLAGNGPLYN